MDIQLLGFGKFLSSHIGLNQPKKKVCFFPYLLNVCFFISVYNDQYCVGFRNC